MRSGSHTEAKRHKIKERERPYQELYFKGKLGFIFLMYSGMSIELLSEGNNNTWVVL
jgi:hypothetical protein